MDPLKKVSNGFTLNGPGVPLPTNPTVPGIYSKLTGTPATNALSSAAQPDWRNTLNTVMKGYTPPTGTQGPVNPARPNQTMTALPQTPKATGLVSKEIKTNVDGSKSEVHYDNKSPEVKTYAPGSEGNWGPSGIKPGTTPPSETPPETSKPTPPDISYAGLIGQGQGLYGQLPGIGQKAADISAEAQKAYTEIGQKGAQGKTGYLSGMGTNPVAMGNAAIVAQNVAAQQGAVTGGAQLGLTGLQQQQQALTGAGAGMAGLAGAVAPRQYGAVMINPITGEAIGGGGNAAQIMQKMAEMEANAATTGDFTKLISDQTAQKSTLDANMSVLNSIASQGGVAADVPMLTALMQKYGQTVGGVDAPAVAQFRAQLEGIRTAYTAAGLGDGYQAIPDTISLSQLKPIQQAIATALQNKIAGYESRLGEIKKGTTGTTSTTGGASGGTVTWDNLPL